MKTKLRQIRLENSIKQAALARELNIGQSTISAIESGQRIPSVLLALKIARSLHCNVEDIFTLEKGD